MTWIDLTMPITDQMPVYPGDVPTRLIRTAGFPADELQLTNWQTSCHAGTHIDAPRHFCQAGRTVDRLSLERLITTAYVAAAPPGPAGWIDLNQVDLSARRPEDALLLATGWESQAGRPAYYADMPLFAPETGRFLSDLQPGLIGVDLPSLVEARDPDGLSGLHRCLLGQDMILIENLICLRNLAGQRVQLIALPLPLTDADGSPARVCARPFTCISASDDI